MRSNDSRPLCVCGCNRPIKRGRRLMPGSHLRHLSPEERFWLQVTKPGGPSDCWLWLGPRSQSGRYGLIVIDGRNVRAHRFALSMQLGRPIAPGLASLHTCDVTLCVRNDEQSHLFEGTHQNNMDDMRAKGRDHHPGAGISQVRGERSPAAKLTESDVREIRCLLAEGHTLRSLAARFGVSKGPITGIARGTLWKHVI